MTESSNRGHITCFPESKAALLKVAEILREYTEPWEGGSIETAFEYVAARLEIEAKNIPDRIVG